MSGPGPVLVFGEVSKSYFPRTGGRVDVLRGVNLTVNPGEFLMITGPSGAGKTTLLNLAALLEPATSGRILFDDREVSGLSEEMRCAVRKSAVGMVFQRSHLLPHRSTAENILFRFRYADVPARETQAATERVMESLGLRDLRDRPVRLLSAGEMQRVAIARAVVLQPRLLLADEPTGNLDRESSGRVMDCFRTLNRQGITVLMVTHNEGLLEYGGRHLMCRNGTLVQGA